MRRRLCAAILLLEAVVLGLTTPVLISISSVSPGRAAVVGIGLLVLCLLTAALLRFRWAYALGWLVQVAAVGLGAVIGAMLFLGAIFLTLWSAAYLMGVKIDREQALREADAAAPGGSH